ncbi:hypothetical protein D9615_003097 [Tricholomella constricta]|uniref:Uncharacterized protein n=1 Tax=Tricholomella constricta TaxID=117010 RepID=A0A8H5HJ54_9AGAR|nr:hypothetical protein D9615_003097 [Tricholomella constricta]
MHTKAAILALLALIAAASTAAPLSDRRSWSDAQRSALRRRANPQCNDEAETYGVSSGLTEGDCANMANATGFKAESVSSACSIPVAGSGQKGICYLGGDAAEQPNESGGGGEPKDPPGGSGSPDENGPCDSTDQQQPELPKTDPMPEGETSPPPPPPGAQEAGSIVNPVGSKPPPSKAADAPSSDPCDTIDQPLKGDWTPPLILPDATHTESKGGPLGHAGAPLLAPVQGPMPSPVGTTASASATSLPAPAEKTNTQLPDGSPKPKVDPGMHAGKGNDMSWVGKSLLKVLGGLF